MSMKRLLAIFLCAGILMSMLTGCGSETKKSDGTDSGMTDKKAEDEKPVTLNLYCPGVTSSGEKDEEILEAISAKILKDTGMNVRFSLTSSDYDEEISTVNRLIAAGELDAWMSAQNYGYVDKGLTADITDLMANYGQNIKAKINEVIYNYHTVDGRLKGLALQSPVRVAITPLIRKDLLDKSGLSVPTTLDEMADTILKIKATDSSLVGITSLIAQWIPLALFSYGAIPEFFDKDGFPVPMIITDYTNVFYEDDYLYEYYGLLHKWYKEGVINPEAFTITRDKFMDLYNRDKIICATWGIENVTQTQADLEKNGPRTAEWVIMDKLRAPNGMPATWGYTAAVANSIYVKKGSKNAETFIRVLDWYCSDKENGFLTLLGIEGVTYKINERNKVTYLQDSSGGYLYESKLGSMFYSAWSPEVEALTKDYVNDEWKKANTMDIYSFVDTNIKYTYAETESIHTTIKTIATEYFVKMVVGDISVEEGIPKMRKALSDAGVERYEAERQKCFKAVYPNGWNNGS